MVSDIYVVVFMKLKEIFGVDVVLYVFIEDYGMSYVVILSEICVIVIVLLVDLVFG